MLQGPVRLAILAGAFAFGAIGATLALVGLGMPFLAGALISAVAAGLVQYAALGVQRPLADPAPDPRLEEYRAATATMRHDLRGILSPALMMSDRLLNHEDPAVQRAGQAVVRSIERATVLLGANKEALGPTPPAP